MTEQERLERIVWLAKMAKIPNRFKNASFKNWIADTTRQKEAKERVVKIAENFKAILDDGIGGAIFYGGVGTGKTHISVALIRAVIGKYHARCRYVNVFDLISEVRATWSRRDITEQEVISRFASYHLLVIDEVGVQYGSESEQVTLFQIINERSLRKLPTILISNLDEKGLMAYVGERVVDRIFENGGGTVAFDWESHRRNNLI